jgi:5'-phosphate synthase pdxT subunit
MVTMNAQATGKRVGVLAVQGDFQAHVRVLSAAGAHPVLIKHPAQIEGVEALVLPGGESTTVLKFFETEDFVAALGLAAKRGTPMLGTCAGAILMAGEVGNGGQLCLRLMDIGIRRNAYGRQLSSFIARQECAAFPGGPLEMVFIRAPIIERVGAGVSVLAECRGRPVLVRQGARLAATFHPELTADLRVHRYFLELAGHSAGAAR